MDLKERIKSLRKEKGFSQDYLADALGVSRQAVSKWENGSARPDIDNVVEMSALFAVSTDYILTGKVSEPLQDIAEGELTDVCPDTQVNDIVQSDIVADQDYATSQSGNVPDIAQGSSDSEKIKKFSGFALGISLFSIGLTASIVILIISAFVPNLLHNRYLNVDLDITFGTLLAICLSIAVVGIVVFGVVIARIIRAKKLKKK